MNGNTDFDRIAQTWLQDGPTQMPDRSLQAALDEVHVTSQRRFGAARRTFPVNGNVFRLAAAAVVALAIIVVGGIYLGNNQSGGVGGAPPTPTASPTLAPPTPTPTPQPTPIDTTSWVPFVSDQYGYEISYPPTATGVTGSVTSAPTVVVRAEREWSSETDQGIENIAAGVEKGSPAIDGFVLGPDGSQIFVTGFASTVPAGMAEGDWFDAVNQPCPTRTGPEDITVDGHPGRIDVGCDASVAVVVVDDRAYVFAEWQGTYPDLLKAFVSTVRLPAPGTSESPSAAP